MKKILILFSLIGCLSFAREFRCLGNKHEDIRYLSEASNPALKKMLIAISKKDESLKKEAGIELKKLLEITTHVINEHDLTVEELTNLIEIKINLEKCIDTLAI